MAQRRGEGIDLSWRKQITPDINSNPQEERKNAKNDKYEGYYKRPVKSIFSPLFS